MREAGHLHPDLLHDSDIAWARRSREHWGPLICKLGHTSCNPAQMRWPAREQDRWQSRSKDKPSPLVGGRHGEIQGEGVDWTGGRTSRQGRDESGSGERRPVRWDLSSLAKLWGKPGDPAFPVCF